MLETCRTDIHADHPGFGMTDRVLRCLPRSASGDEYIQIGAIFLFGPQQMMFGTVDILVAPHFASAVQVFDRWRKRVSGVEVANGIGVCLRCTFSRFSLHECSLYSEICGGGDYTRYSADCADQSTSRPNRTSSSRRPALVTRIALLSRSFV